MQKLIFQNCYIIVGGEGEHDLWVYGQQYSLVHGKCVLPHSKPIILETCESEFFIYHWPVKGPQTQKWKQLCIASLRSINCSSCSKACYHYAMVYLPHSDWIYRILNSLKDRFPCLWPFKHTPILKKIFKVLKKYGSCAKENQSVTL